MYVVPWEASSRRWKSAGEDLGSDEDGVNDRVAFILVSLKRIKRERTEVIGWASHGRNGRLNIYDAARCGQD